MKMTIHLARVSRMWALNTSGCVQPLTVISEDQGIKDAVIRLIKVHIKTATSVCQSQVEGLWVDGFHS